MNRYRKISVSIHGDEKFNSLSKEAQLIWFKLLTHPHLTGLGCMRASLPGLADEFGYQQLKGFKIPFGELLAQGMVRVCEKAKFICLPRFLRHNPPDNPNVIKSWRKLNGLIPECALKNEYLEQVKGFVEGLGEGYAAAFREAFPIPFPRTLPQKKGGSNDFNNLKGMPKQEQEQEQEQEQDTNIRARQEPRAPSPDDLGKIWNDVAPTALARVRLPFEEDRRKKIRPKIKINPDKSYWINLFTCLAACPFLLGESRRGWRATFDWVVQRRVEILEGKYLPPGASWPKVQAKPRKGCPTCGKWEDLCDCRKSTLPSLT